jgi:hypothetical protein
MVQSGKNLVCHLPPQNPLRSLSPQRARSAKNIIAHTMASNSAPIPPLFKAENPTLTFSASKDGKLRATYTGWDDARACASGAMVERGAP